MFSFEEPGLLTGKAGRAESALPSRQGIVSQIEKILAMTEIKKPD